MSIIVITSNVYAKSIQLMAKVLVYFAKIKNSYEIYWRIYIDNTPKNQHVILMNLFKYHLSHFYY